MEENLSNMLLEANACGVPSVAFDVGGNGDVITNGANGFLVKPFSVEDFADRIQDCVAPSFKFDMSMLLKFEIQAVSTRYIHLYDEVLASAN